MQMLEIGVRKDTPLGFPRDATKGKTTLMRRLCYVIDMAYILRVPAGRK